MKMKFKGHSRRIRRLAFLLMLVLVCTGTLQENIFAGDGGLPVEPESQTEAQTVTETVDQIESQETNEALSGMAVMEPTTVNGTEKNYVDANIYTYAGSLSNPLEGASVKIVEGDGPDGELVTSWVTTADPKQVSFEWGKSYTVLVTEMPYPYAIPESYYVEITDEGKINCRKGKTWWYDRADADVYLNADLVSGVYYVTFEAKDLNRNNVSGAQFKLVEGENAAGREIESWSDDGHQVLLNTGNTYTLIETVPPTGYMPAFDITFRIPAGGGIELAQRQGAPGNILWQSIKGGGIEIKHVPLAQSQEVYLSKTDLTGGVELPGAELVLMEVRGVVKHIYVTSWISTDEPKKIILEREKTYRLTETLAPEGYELAQAIRFRITSEGTLEIEQADGSWAYQENSTVVMRDAAKILEVGFSKTELSQTEELPGAQLKVIEGDTPDGTLVEAWTSTTTVKNIELEYNKTYTMIETAAPDGYETAQNIVFRITAQGLIEIRQPDGMWSLNADNIVRMEDVKKTVGSLTVKKTLRGNAVDENKAFTFTVTLDDPQINETFSGLKFTDGVADFKLKGGECRVIEGLPGGTGYKVTESDNEGYTVESTGTAGTISESSPAVADITNIRDAYGSLTVQKTVEGNSGDLEKLFDFTVTLNDKNINGTFGAVEFVNGMGSFTLKSGESVQIKHLPTGTYFEVKEKDYTEEGYITTSTTDTTGVIGEDTISLVSFVNVRNTVGSLTVTKKVDGNSGDKKKEFNFTVKLSDNSINGSYGDMNFVSGTAVFTLKHNESKTAEKLPNGITFVVTEDDYTAEGYTCTQKGGSGTITGDKTMTADFTNTKTTAADAPKTGDTANPGLWLAMFCLAAFVIAVSITYKIKRRKDI